MDERGRMGLNAVLISKKLSTNFQLRVFVVRPGSYSMIAHRWASSQMLAQTNLRFDPELRSRKTPPARPGSKFIFSRKSGWPFEWNFKCESLNAPASRLMMQPIVHQLRRSRPGTVLHLDQIRQQQPNSMALLEPFSKRKEEEEKFSSLFQEGQKDLDICIDVVEDVLCQQREASDTLLVADGQSRFKRPLNIKLVILQERLALLQ